MNPTAPDPRWQRARSQLAGYPPEVVAAAESAWSSRAPAAADRLLHAVFAHYLQDAPVRRDLAALPDEALIVQEVGLDSLLIVEVGYFFEGLFETRISDDELRRLLTLGDLRALVRAKVAALPA